MRAAGQPDAITQAATETERLFAQHSANLILYLRSGFRDANEFEDIAQEAFVRYFRVRCNGEEIDNPKGWLYRVARRLAIDFAKKSKPILLDDEGWRGLEGTLADRQNDAGAERSELWSSLPWNQLSPLEKECLLLRAEGLTFREVAEILDVSISTVASYVARAIKKFRRAVPKPSETPDHRRATPLR